jgi:ketosteroid isomerase-like protein
MSVDMADDLEAIRQLTARYFRLMDMKDWAGWAQCFTEDVVVRVDSAVSDGRNLVAPFPIPTGRDAFVAQNSETLRGVVTVHHGHMPEIALTSATTATGVWSMEDKLIWRDGSRLHGFGHYHETYRKEADGEWRIATIDLTRLRLDHLPPPTA